VYSTHPGSSSSSGIVDLLTLLGHIPAAGALQAAVAATAAAAADRSDSGAPSSIQNADSNTSTAPLLHLLDRHGVGAAATLSVAALHHDALSGNAETVQACAGEARLFPAWVLDPRLPRAERLLSGANAARLLCLLPGMQAYAVNYAPIRRLLRHLAEQQQQQQTQPAGGSNNNKPLPPLLFESVCAGDATRFAAFLNEAGYAGPVLLSGVSGASGTLAEALAIAEEMPQIAITTDGLRGIGEVDAAVETLGAERVVFASGAPVRSLGAALAVIRHARLDAQAERLVLGDNARRLLGGGADPMRSAAALIDGAMGAE
jgi:hypothetical protein